MKEALISVIIPVYNTAEYLERSVLSVLENTYQNLEVICVNDGSTDNSLEVLNKIAMTDDRVKVLDKENGGVSSARNLGLRAVKGEWISFVDSDDWIHKDFYAALLNAADDETDIVACGHANVYNDDLSAAKAELPNRYSVEYVGIHGIYRDMHLCSSCWGKIYRKNSIANIYFPEGLQLSEDGIFNAEVFSREPVIKKAGLVMYYYFSRNSSLVHTKPPERYIAACNAYLNLADTIQNKDICLYQAFRLVLTFRYEGTFGSNRAGVYSSAKPIIRRCLKLLRQDRYIPTSTKIMLTVAGISPMAYRLSLIIKDPTYLRWEKVLKERAKHMEK